MKRIQSLIFSVIISGLIGACYAEATSYTVKAGGGGNYTTISACASAASAGDTCTVYAGSYGGWTQTQNGSAGSPITFTVNPGDSVTVTSGITVNGVSYVTFGAESGGCAGSGTTVNSPTATFVAGGCFNFNGTITGNGSTRHLIISHNSATTTLFRINDGQGSNGSDNVLSYNMVNLAGQTGNAEGFYVYGDRNRFEYNEIKNGEGDCHDLGGANVVVRYTYCHDINGASGEHIDFVQVVGGGTSPTLSFSLLENNAEQHCYNDGGNCHALIVRTGGSGTCPGSWSVGNLADTVIYRYNYAQNLDGSGVSFGGVGDCAPNWRFYNNTFVDLPTGGSSSSANCVSQQNAPNGAALNNICYNIELGGAFPVGGSAPPNNGNIGYTVGYSGSWNAPYSSEATYSILHNKDPQFASYPTNPTLQATSPAIGAGASLTTVANTDSGSGTSLMVADSHFFQPGWAGTNADWIRVGTTTTVQITSVNYATNTLTLANPISRSSGEPVYLYKNSDGHVVLFGSGPDVGASPYFAPATSLGAVAH